MARKKNPDATPKPEGEKKAKKPRRPATELLEIANAKVTRFERLLRTWQTKVAKLEVQVAKTVSDDIVREIIGNKSAAEIEAEQLELNKRLAILNRGMTLVTINGTKTEVPGFLAPAEA